MSNSSEPPVFISYANHDGERVTELARDLDKAGIAIWRDHERILGGGSYGADIVRAIKHSKVLLLICSNASLRSKNVKQEIQLAWKYNVPYLPVLLEPLSYPEQVEYWLEGWQWIEMLDHPVETWLPLILSALSQCGIEGNIQAPMPPQPARNSWLERLKTFFGKEKPASSDLVATAVKAISQQQDLKGLHALAKYTDQIWPVPADVSISHPRGLRDLGVPQESVQHAFPLGSQVRLVIESDRQGHLLLLDEGTSGKLYCLCPSQFAPDTKIPIGRSIFPQANSRYDAFTVTGKRGREHLLAIITDQPLPLTWMPSDVAIPAKEVQPQDIADLLAVLHDLGENQWVVLSTYFDVI